MKSIFFAALVAGLMAGVAASAAAQGTIAKVHGDGKDKLVVESGGEIEFKSGSTFTVPAGTIDTAKIGAAAVTAVKLADGAVETAKIGTSAVSAVKIAANVVNTSKIETVSSSGQGTLLCYTNDGKIGKVTAAVEAGGMDTGKVTTCAAF